jgi:hypothetical protein
MGLGRRSSCCCKLRAYDPRAAQDDLVPSQAELRGACWFAAYRTSSKRAGAYLWPLRGRRVQRRTQPALQAVESSASSQPSSTANASSSAPNHPQTAHPAQTLKGDRHQRNTAALPLLPGRERYKVHDRARRKDGRHDRKSHEHRGSDRARHAHTATRHLQAANEHYQDLRCERRRNHRLRVSRQGPPLYWPVPGPSHRYSLTTAGRSYSNAPDTRHRQRATTPLVSDPRLHAAEPHAAQGACAIGGRSRLDPHLARSTLG